MWNYVSRKMTLNAISAENPLARHSKRNGQSRKTELSGSILFPKFFDGVRPIIADSQSNANGIALLPPSTTGEK